MLPVKISTNRCKCKYFI